MTTPDMNFVAACRRFSAVSRAGIPARASFDLAITQLSAIERLMKQLQLEALALQGVAS